MINIPSKKTLYRQRQKLTKMIYKKINVEEVKTTIVSFCAYLNIGNSYKYIKYLNDKLNKLGGEKSLFKKLDGN